LWLAAWFMQAVLLPSQPLSAIGVIVELDACALRPDSC
jgi:hypothetical protein